jgi:hypothetical protein
MIGLINWLTWLVLPAKKSVKLKVNLKPVLKMAWPK